MTAKATSPEPPSCQIDLDVEQDTNGRGYTINYIPSIPGMHNIHLYYDNKLCLSSPITLKVLDLDSLHDIVITKSLPVYVEQVTDDVFRIAFIPKSSNTFMVSVFFADKHIGGSPFRVLYQEQTKDPSVAIHFEPDMNIKGPMGAAVYGRNSGRQVV